MSIQKEIDNLDFGTVEEIIVDFFDMGYPDNSSFPMEFSENSSDTYTLFASKGYGRFHIRTAKKDNGKYDLTDH